MKIYIPVEEKIPLTEQNVTTNNKVIEFYSFDDEGIITDKNDYYTMKIEEIDQNEKISRNVFFKYVIFVD